MDTTRFICLHCCEYMPHPEEKTEVSVFVSFNFKTLEVNYKTYHFIKFIKKIPAKCFGNETHVFAGSSFIHK